MPNVDADLKMTTGEVHFHHVQMYADSISSISDYKAMEERLAQLASQVNSATTAECRAAWEKYGDAADPTTFVGEGQDIVDQMIHGLGWRIRGAHAGDGTETVVLGSEDDAGVRFIVTGKKGGEPAAKKKKADFDHFARSKVDEFYSCHADRQGIAVLGFEVVAGGVAAIHTRYTALHPKLVVENSPRTYDNFKIFEVYSYYVGEAKVSDADKGTILRFVERTNKASTEFLPGVTDVTATFDGTSCPAYFDHWVSNVVSRTGFLDTLADTLDFTTKVDFNAGVVAAGEAQIESTVMGNTSSFSTSDPAAGLVNQSQVYLPTNNALSEVGHVHMFIEQMGQGIQHLANRVGDLTQFIARVNRYREITGKGFTFLNIPRSYYGRLTAAALCEPKTNGIGLDNPVSAGLASAVMEALVQAGLLDHIKLGIVKLDVSEAEVESIGALLPEEHRTEFGSRLRDVVNVVIKSQYANLYKLLHDHLDHEAYLGVVRNKILVDIQNNDVLYQIFTCTILQREAGQEAPFLEFIQRVCSSKDDSPITPGCGGFGIRNFLTLFLSIEVSKAMRELDDALEKSNTSAAALAQKKIDIFTRQLDESNPVLTAITDAMTAEGHARAAAAAAATTEEAAAAMAEAAKFEAEKEAGNTALQEMSARYCALMNDLRTKGVEAL